MTATQRKKLQTAEKRLNKCGGDCHHCEKCHIYTRSTERALYMATGCDLLPAELFDSICNVPSELHAAALEAVQFELA